MFCASIDKLDSVFKAEYDRAKILIQSSKHGIDVDVKKHIHKRSSEANAYYWLFNGELAEFLNNSGVCYGEHQIPYSAELIHEINKKLFGIKTTTKLSVGDFCSYMNRLLLFWQEKTGGEFAMSELPANYLERKGYTIF